YDWALREMEEAEIITATFEKIGFEPYFIRLTKTDAAIRRDIHLKRNNKLLEVFQVMGTRFTDLLAFSDSYFGYFRINSDTTWKT
ncbi:MAG: hypothetical protein RL037_583, partial [Bacteroidota bacterium]